tara:strand:- start:752 stop:1354 length:603 start_codon:yes stop_codon:yes gene_type:complete
MPTLSYAISSLLLITPFVAAGVLSETVDDYTYGQWLAVLIAGVTGFVLLRILNKEVTISSLIQASKTLRIGRKGVSTDSGTSIFDILIKLALIPGYLFSFIFFPNSNFGFYIGSIILLFSLGIFTVKSFDELQEAGQINNGQKNTYSFAIIFGSMFLFLALRYFSDGKVEEILGLGNYITEEKLVNPPATIKDDFVSSLT